jgi:actin-related protein
MEEDEKQKTTLEYYQDSLKKVQEESTRLEEIFLDARKENLKTLREYWINVIIFSVPLIVGVISLMNSSDSIIKNNELAIFAVFLLSIIPMIGAFYINRLLLKENKGLKTLSEDYMRRTSEHVEKLLDCQKEKKDIFQAMEIMIESTNKDKDETKKIKESLQENKKVLILLDKYFSNIITYLFISGIIFIFLSFLGQD